MTEDFSISVEWISGNEGPPEIRETSGLIGIRVGQHIATRSEDEWSKSVRPSVRLSAYPLALWIASSWWRLRWEPATDRSRRIHEWRMSHETSSAGYGYVWPRLTFESDGERVEAICTPSVYTRDEPIRYLDGFRSVIDGREFERVADDFVSLTLARLSAVGLRETQLHSLWREVCEERADAGASVQRRLEARLGFEPDDAPESLLSRVMQLIPVAGSDAVSEIAPACAGHNSDEKLDVVIAAAAADAPKGKLADIGATSSIVAVSAPWDRGWAFAKRARNALALNGKPVSNDVFSEILGLPASVIDESQSVSQKLPLGMAVRSAESDSVKYIFRRKHYLGRRFEAARFLADSLIAPSDDRWLPATDAKTARQKAQRAFAAEFLCPIESLIDVLGDDFSIEAISDASDYFEVSSLAIRSHLANNGYIHPMEVIPDVPTQPDSA